MHLKACEHQGMLLSLALVRFDQGEDSDPRSTVPAESSTGRSVGGGNATMSAAAKAAAASRVAVPAGRGFAGRTPCAAAV